MSLFSSIRTIGSALGIRGSDVLEVGCSLGRTVYFETKRAAQIANVLAKRRALLPETKTRLSLIFPELDVGRIRYRTHCRLPANRFNQGGSVYAMTFGYTIYWRGAFDETNDADFVNFIHEVFHVDQVRRFGGEREFACEYGKGFLAGNGVLPSYIRNPTRYHRNPLEADAYSFEAKFQDERGRVAPELLP